MTHTELLKAKQHIDIQNQIEAFLNKGGSVEEVKID